MQAVRALPNSKRGRRGLVDAAADPSLQVAREALARLARIGTREEAAVLHERLLTAGLALVRPIAVTVRELGDERGAAEAAIEGLRDASPSVRMRAALSLGELAHRDRAAALRVALDDGMAGVRRSAIEALGRGTIAREDAVAIAGRLHDVDAVVRSAAVRALATPGRDLSPLRGVLHDPSPAVRVELARHTRLFDDDLVRALLRDSDSDVRAQTVWALVDEPRPQLEPLLVGALADDDWRVRRASCRALAAARLTGAAPALMPALVDPHETVRAAAARALNELFGSRTVGVLVAELPRSDARLRRALVYTAAKLDASGALPGLLPYANDGDADVRIAIAHLAAHVRTPQATAILHRLARDTDRDVAHAARTLLDGRPG
jgi:HEAT repeat protein